MVWKMTLAAGAAALIAPLAQLVQPGPTLEVSAASWTGAVRQVQAPAAGPTDPAFLAAVERAAMAVCTPANSALRNVAREQACVKEAIARAQAAAHAL